MINLKVLIADKIGKDGIDLLKKEGVFVDEDFTISHDSLVRKIEDFDAIIVRSRTQITKEVIEAGKRLKVIGRSGSGLDNIDLTAAKTSQIEIVNTPEANSVSVAEHTFALLLSLFRKIPLANTSLKEGKWLKHELMGNELRGKTLGIVGCGHIGLEVARRGAVFQMNVLGYDNNGKALSQGKEMDIRIFGPDQSDLYSMLQLCDIVSLHIPLNSWNYRFFGEKEFSSMKRGSYFINTSRGAIIDEEALLKALNENKIIGAALDVFEIEPPKTENTYSLIRHPNVICTPHIGASTYEARKSTAVNVAEKVINILKDVKA